MASGAPNVWTQMNYVPPRGQCNYKQSIVSQKCPCLRFMLHPLKSSSSYECDGCNHHASFHNMENKIEDEIRKRWEQEARDKAAETDETHQRSKKRVRAIEYNAAAGSSLDNELQNTLGRSAGNAGGSTRARGGTAKKTARAVSGRAKNRITEVVEDDEYVVELD